MFGRRQEAVVGARLAGEVDALGAPLVDHVEPVLRREMEDVDRAAGVLGEEAHALDRLDLGERRPRLDVRQRVVAALLL